jgi:hypothetical protein
MDPLVDEDDETWTWWAPCAATRPPWLLRAVEWCVRVIGRTLGLLP